MTRIDEERPKKEAEPQHQGVLVIITGPSGVGKDTVFKKLLESEKIAHLKPRRAVTMASRERRVEDDEVEGVHYYFRTLDYMQEMAKQGGFFMEELTQTGNTFKATPTSEILPAINGNNVVILRVDMSRAGEIAKGLHFDKHYGSEIASKFNERTLVICIAPDSEMTKEQVTKRRMDRDGEDYDPSDYEIRDVDEALQMMLYQKHYHHVIENKNDRLEDTIQQVEQIILNFAFNRNI